MGDDLDRVLEEVEWLDREATPGPWNPCGVTGCSCGLVWSGNGSHTIANCGDEEEGVAAHVPDASLIAHYRTAAPLLAAEVRRLRADLAFADQQGAEAIERVSTAIVADKWNATAAFQDRAIKAEMENARLNVLLTASVTETARMQTERDELRALWTAEQQEHRQTARECGDACQDALALRAELEEARLTLAAEQGRQEGAPSERWYPEVRSGRVRWHRGDPDEAPEVSVFGLADGWRWTEPGHESRPYPTARAAMLAADATQEPR